MARTVVPITELTPTKATLTTALAGTNNDLTFTAKSGGSWGNSIQVEYIDPGGTSATLDVTVRGFVVSVSLGRAASAINSTAQNVMDAINQDLDAMALITAALASSNDGTGLVIALTATSLAGGEWAVTLPAVTNGDATNDHYVSGGADGKTIVQVVSTDVGSQTVTVKRSPLLRAGAPPSDEVVTVAAGATRELGPFAQAEFAQNAAKDLYFDPSVSSTLDFRAYRTTQVT